MAYSNTVFRQLVNLIPSRPFHSEVERTGANRYTKHFTAWNQLIVNLYAQASGKKSLRDIETGLEVQSRAWYHLGLKNISRSQLSYVNTRRDYRLFQSLGNATKRNGNSIKSKNWPRNSPISPDCPK